ncbi:MAG: nucleotidyltransferase family protein [Candidatus Omnitrophica bacterium]|nr:nucleotidyltransferase family protein [Candidatus Omnitrophota bacterium]
MSKLEEIKNNLEQHKKELREEFHVKEIGLFGSFVREEDDESSDLDILVEFEEVPGLLLFARLKDYLSKLTGVKVDLVMRRVLKPYIGKNILQEVIYL